MPPLANSKAKIGVLGASGYTGAELVRLLGHRAREEHGVLDLELPYPAFQANDIGLELRGKHVLHVIGPL